MARPNKPVTAPRTPLTRERVLRAAVAFADANGIGTLSMRKLGEALGVEAMSLYNHVANKDQLLDGMVDLVFSEIDLPDVGADWKTAMRRPGGVRPPGAGTAPVGDQSDVDADLTRPRHAAAPRRRHREPSGRWLLRSP